jgi:hypothetical protein
MSRPTRATAGGRAYLDLQNLARRQRRSTQELLVLYVLERFLARLAISGHREKFVLKGGMLLAALSARRPTVDTDLLGTHLSNQTDEVLTRVVEIASTPMSPDDGVAFLTDTARPRIIREGDLYSGVRVTMAATIAEAAVKLQLDINFGDPVTPAPATITYPGLPSVRILGYPLATVLAEKLTTAIELGAGNSRIRDYADVWTPTGLHHLGAADVLHQDPAHHRGAPRNHPAPALRHGRRPRQRQSSRLHHLPAPPRPGRRPYAGVPRHRDRRWHRLRGSARPRRRCQGLGSSPANLDTMPGVIDRHGPCQDRR